MRLLYSCVIFLATSYYYTVFRKVHILVSYPWQPRIIAPYSETCTYCILVSYSWQPPIITLYSERCIFLCHILGNLVLLHCILKHVLIVFLCHILGNLLLLNRIPKGAYSCVIFLATSYYLSLVAVLYSKRCIFLCHILFKLAHILMSYYLCGIKVPHDNISLVVSY